jgi:protein-S-isoprenylcysteine O-methyltransferase
MRFDALSLFAFGFYGATFAAEKLLLRYFGLVLGFANWLSAAPVFLPLLCATLYRIRVEEAALREHFGEEYATYARDTKRLVPGVF